MTGKKNHNQPTTNLPLVSVCTPTFNRRPFIQFMFDCFRHQDYPMSRIEWIIVDDGTDKIEDLVIAAKIPQIRYFRTDERMVLGRKRNFMHEQCSGSIIVYMDDDDYYPPERISHAVHMLRTNPSAMCAGSSILHIYFKHINKVVEFGPYGPNHATAGTFAFRRKLLNTSCYDDDAAIAEEKSFLKNYTVPFVQLDPKKTILVFSHNHNTFDKRRLLENPNPAVVKFTDLNVRSFVHKDSMNTFIMDEIDGLLEEYDPGHPKHKPEVLKQMEVLTKRRKEATNDENGPLVRDVPGKPPHYLTNKEIRESLNAQNARIRQLDQVVVIAKQQVADTQALLDERDKRIAVLENLLTEKEGR